MLKGSRFICSTGFFCVIVGKCFKFEKSILDLSVGKHGGTVVHDLSVVQALSPIVAQMFEI